MPNQVRDWGGWWCRWWQSRSACIQNLGYWRTDVDVLVGFAVGLTMRDDCGIRFALREICKEGYGKCWTVVTPAQAGACVVKLELRLGLRPKKCGKCFKPSGKALTVGTKGGFAFLFCDCAPFLKGQQLECLRFAEGY